MFTNFLLMLVVLAVPLVFTVLSVALTWSVPAIVGIMVFDVAVPTWFAALLGPVMLWLSFSALWVDVAYEADLVRRHGESQALWVRSSAPSTYHGGHISRAVVEPIVWAGHDYTGRYLGPFAQRLGLSTGMTELATEGVSAIGSVIWSRYILFLDRCVCSKYSLLAVVCAWSILFWRMTKFIARRAYNGIQLFVLILFLVGFMPARSAGQCLLWIMRAIVKVQRVVTDPLAYEFLQWQFTCFCTDLALAVDGCSFEVRQRYSERLAGRGRSYIGTARLATMDAVKFITDVGLPSFIRKRFKWGQTLDEIQAGRDIMQALGWPVNVEHREPVDVEGAPNQYPEWRVSGTDFATGIKQMRTYVEQNMDLLRVTALQYRRSEEYQSVANELHSTSRYFVHANYEFDNTPVDDVWFVLQDIFRHSRLTPFNTVIALWEKKYALGFYMKDPKRNVKYKRRDFIRTMGFKNFKKLWADTFYYASMVLPVAHVSVKGEALPEKKWLNGLVRSVIGSPLSHYIASTVFNFGPNHTFAWDTTPVKVGMPLNGYWMSQIFSRHARFNHHVEGDFTAFDSTLSGSVLDVIREVRKRGYDHHRDRTRICELIDIMYDQLDSQMLGMTSTGNVYKKDTGLTTGHSSTSMDNSVALVTLYLMAWKSLTGLGAAEFLHFNELSCYGDDHVLSFPSARPLSWTPKNIARVMSKWGLTNNLEVKRLEDIGFLKKYCRRSNADDVAMFKKLQIPVQTHVVWHDKASLVGKLKARVKNLNPTYRLNRLLSYLDLTAHHRDVYDGIVAVINASATMRAHLKATKRTIPSYENVVARWYKKTSAPVLHEDEDDYVVADNVLLNYGVPTVWDHALAMLSMVPDLLNPVVFNTGFSRTLQSNLQPLLLWAIELIVTQNDVVNATHFARVSAKTHYSVLDPTLYLGGLAKTNMSSLFVRHWAYLTYCHFRPVIPRLTLGSFLVRKSAAIQFAVNGRVQMDLPSADFGVDKLIVIAALSFVHVPAWFDFISMFRTPDFGTFLDLAWNFLLSFVWSNVPINYREIDPLLKGPYGTSCVVTAPTGTGKSTNMVAYMSRMFSHKFNRVVVIEPRVVLAVGLAQYVERTYSIRCTAGTGASQLDPAASVWYMTSGSFLSHLHLMKSTFLYVIDEAHLHSPEYDLCQEFIGKLGGSLVLTTATPSQKNIDSAQYDLHLATASIWSVRQDKVSLPGTDPRDYIKWVRGWMAANGSRKSFAVIVDTPEEAQALSNSYHGDSQVLSSKHDPVIRPVNAYFCTTVVDVGVTMPDIDVIVFPGWVYNGAGDRRAISNAVVKQRCGRVGRTRNGVAIQVDINVALNPQELDSKMNAVTMRALISSGVSPYVLAASNAPVLGEILGVQLEKLDAEVKERVLKTAALFMDNWRPSFIESSRPVQDVVGEPVNLKATGIGIISSRPSINMDQLVADAINSMSLAARHLVGDNVVDDLDALAQKYWTFPSTKVLLRDMVQMLKSGSGDFLSLSKNPLNIMGDMLDDLSELEKIYQLLKEIESLD